MTTPAYSSPPVSNVFAEVQLQHINQFRSDANKLWDIDFGIVFASRTHHPDYFQLSMYRNGVVSLATVQIQQLPAIGFYSFPIIFYFASERMPLLPLKSYQTLLRLPATINPNFDFCDILTNLINSFQAALFAAFPSCSKYGICYVYAELFRGRIAIPLFQFYLSKLQLPLIISTPLTHPLMITPIVDTPLPEVPPKKQKLPEPMKPIHSLYPVSNTPYQPLATSGPVTSRNPFHSLSLPRISSLNQLSSTRSNSDHDFLL